MVLTVAGVDLTPYVHINDMQFSREDVDGDNAGRVIGNAAMHRDYLATKDKLQCSCRILSQSECAAVMAAIEGEYVTVSYTSPRYGLRSNIKMYCSKSSCKWDHCANNVDYWKGLSFALTEV